MVADELAADAFVVGESAWSEHGIQFRDGHVGCSWEGWDRWDVDVDAAGVGGWEQQRGQRDLSTDGCATAGVEEQREVSVVFGGAYDRDSYCLLQDFFVDGELGENVAMTHVGVGGTAFGTDVFERGLSAGGDPEAARGDAQGAWVA